MVMLPSEGTKQLVRAGVKGSIQGQMDKPKVDVKINEHYSLYRRSGLHRAEVLGKFKISFFSKM